MFLTQQIKVYFHKVAKQVYFIILLIIQRKSWYNYEKELTNNKSYKTEINILQTDAQNKIHEYSGI